MLRSQPNSLLNSSCQVELKRIYLCSGSVIAMMSPELSMALLNCPLTFRNSSSTSLPLGDVSGGRENAKNFPLFIPVNLSVVEHVGDCSRGVPDRQMVIDHFAI